MYKAQWFCFSVCCKGDVNLTYKGDANSPSGENWKEPSSSTISSSTISTEASSISDSNEKTLNLNKTYWQKEKTNGI